jgi:hypothetical protein
MEDIKIRHQVKIENLTKEKENVSKAYKDFKA